MIDSSPGSERGSSCRANYIQACPLAVRGRTGRADCYFFKQKGEALSDLRLLWYNDLIAKIQKIDKLGFALFIRTIHSQSI